MGKLDSLAYSQSIRFLVQYGPDMFTDTHANTHTHTTNNFKAARVPPIKENKINMYVRFHICTHTRICTHTGARCRCT